MQQFHCDRQIKHNIICIRNVYILGQFQFTIIESNFNLLLRFFEAQVYIKSIKRMLFIFSLLLKSILIHRRPFYNHIEEENKSDQQKELNLFFARHSEIFVLFENIQNYLGIWIFFSNEMSGNKNFYIQLILKMFSLKYQSCCYCQEIFSTAESK